MKGFVSLVGAGPGDPGLLTLKARDRIRQADLIVYDYLANPEHLRHASKEAVKIGVGKGFRHKTLPQEKINRLIVSFARKGKRVVRLKGGDPYLFGRGGEEALHLERHQIPFEVVPGVTSATACAAYAGIPLTHRDHNASVTFLTGHRADDNNLDSIPWKKIAGIGGTIVIYMGFYNLKKIAAQLVSAGMPASMPAAVIQWGTLPRQKSVSASLGNIAEAVKKNGLSAPCIIIIGDVVALGKKLAWYERLPLFGKTLVVTRAEDKSSAFRTKLESLGAEVIELPLIRIEAPLNLRLMDKAVRESAGQDWLIFASAYGVESFFGRLFSLGKDSRSLKGVRVAAVGPKTAEALLSHGIKPDLLPSFFHSEALAKALLKKEGSLRGKKIQLFRTDIAPTDLETKLRTLGAAVQPVTAYRTTAPKKIDPAAQEKILSGEADYAAFTSASTVRHFAKFFGKSDVRRIAAKTRFLSIGPVTTKTLKSYGMKVYLQPKVFTVDGLIDSLVRKEAPGKRGKK